MKNSKCIIIDENYNIIPLGNMNEKSYHITSIIKYVKNKYPYELKFMMYNFEKIPYMLISILLNDYNNIIFLNCPNFTRKTIFINMPNTINEQQLKLIYKVLDEFPDYKIFIENEIKMINGELDSKIIGPLENENPKEFIARYYNNNLNRRKK